MVKEYPVELEPPVRAKNRIKATFTYDHPLFYCLCGNRWNIKQFCRHCHQFLNQFDIEILLFGWINKSEIKYIDNIWACKYIITSFLVAKLLYEYKCPSVCTSTTFRGKRDFLVLHPIELRILKKIWISYSSHHF